MAAAALTSLSTSPLLLGAPAVAFSTEPSLEPWREAPVRPPGSSGSSGDGGWGPTSDQSSPSTPSPPLPPEAAHFLFGEPALRKRKVSQGSPWSGVDMGGAEADRPLSPRARCRGCSSVCGSAAGRKPRGDAKKCRKVYGMDHRDLWCTACRWKKACQRFLD
eukprot:bmy_14494T0